MNPKRELFFRVRDLARDLWLDDEDTSLHCFTAYFLSFKGEVKAVDGALEDGAPNGWADLKWIDYTTRPLKITKSEERFVTQQFTGREDSKKKKIFEGDIVRVNGIITVIEWRGSGFYTNKSEYALDTCWFAGGGPEVIGNIFDNPELLK